MQHDGKLDNCPFRGPLFILKSQPENSSPRKKKMDHCSLSKRGGSEMATFGDRGGRGRGDDGNHCLYRTLTEVSSFKYLGRVLLASDKNGRR